jgi:hypothetical protein
MYIAFLGAELVRSASRRNAVAPGSGPSRREEEISATLARLRALEIESGATVNAETEDEKPLRFVVAETRTTILNPGRRSEADIFAYSELNKPAVISHSITMRLTTPSGTTTFPQMEDGTGVWKRLSHHTYTPVRGLNCTESSRLSAHTHHTAGGWFGDNPVALSLDEATCGGIACESSDEPPTGVTTGPYEPGFGTGEGSDGTTGGDCGGSGGSAPPGSSCHDEYVYVERSTDGGVTWTVVWEGWSIVCT